VSTKIKDPIIELLAIKLYEHDGFGRHTIFGHLATGGREGWLKIDDEDREIYRRMARGETAIGKP
jgi:hypothetical protein